MEATTFREIAPSITPKDNDVRVVARELCSDTRITTSLSISCDPSTSGQKTYVDNTMVLSSNVGRVRWSTQDEMPFHGAKDRSG